MVGVSEVEAIRRHYARLRGGGNDIVRGFDLSLAEFIHPEIEWNEPFGTFRGADQLRAMIVAHAGSGAEYVAFLAEHVFPVRGEGVCATGRSIGKYRAGGRIDSRWVKLWAFSGAQAVRMTSFNEDAA